MKTLVVYYSRHGHTGKVANQVAKILHSSVEEIHDTKDREHLVSWSKSAFDEELRNPTKILNTKEKASDYDLVIIGTPIWDGVSPAIKAYLSMNRFKRVAFFLTFGSAAENGAYIMEKLSKKRPLAILELQDRQIDLGEDKERIVEFCSMIKRKV